jgi:hypothetical protein
MYKNVFTASAILVALVAIAGCSDGAGAGSGGGGAAAVSGSFTGTYEVPVPAELASAAVYVVPEVSWSIVGGVATLEYDLPLGLVGTRVRVAFTGAFDAATSTAHLTGAAGTADCTLAAGKVSCSEVMPGLVFTPDYTVIASIAATDYAGPAQNRVDVAKRFAGDPIGIVHADLATPSASSGTETEGTEPEKD